MKVVFLQDVPKVANAGEIKEVADGYGRNYLIPKNLAVLADSAALRAAETQRKIKVHTQAQEEAKLADVAEQLSSQEITLKAKVGAKEHLYGSITSADIATELQNAIGLDIDKRKIELDEPIRQLGSYDVAVRLGKDIVSKIKVTVVPQDAG